MELLNKLPCLRVDGSDLDPYIIFNIKSILEVLRMVRSSGILMHISSLPSPYGIGTMGEEAYNFVDFLHNSGQRYWQILPICPTSFGDSPYQSFSTFAGNPYFIDLDKLCDEGLLKKSDYENLDWGNDPTYVDYAKLYELRFTVLRKAYNTWKENNQEMLSRFRQTNAEWIEEYAIFMSIKNENGGKAWYEWAPELRLRDPEALQNYRKNHSEDISFWVFTQYMFYRQWNELKLYASEKNVSIIGDLPIYVARDSADVWANPEIFWLDQDLNPVRVAGCPPDGFSATGQLWGNPLYRWDVMKEDKYSWWVRRMKAASEVYDIIRIDHFRGFDSYFAIPYGDETAEFGEWMEGPGIEFFISLEQQLGKLDIIAEDLGFLTQSVHDLLQNSGFPGMKVLEFAFDSRESSDYLPHTYEKNCVVYTGTHDNETVTGWMHTAPREDIEYAKRYLRLRKSEGYNWGLIKAVWASVGDLAIAQMQDFLDLGSESRMNIPSTVGENWRWRAEKEAFNEELETQIYDITKLYGRLVKGRV